MPEKLPRGGQQLGDQMRHSQVVLGHPQVSVGSLTGKCWVTHRWAQYSEIKGYWYAHQKYGRLPWSDLFEPAIKMAAEGFPVTPSLGTVLRDRNQTIAVEPSLSEIFTNKKTGKVFKEGEIMTRPKLANTLRVISREGMTAFYNGSLTDDILQDLQDIGSIISREDLMNYQPLEKKPVEITLSGSVRVFSPGVPSGGPMMALILNNILAGLRRFAHNLTESSSVAVVQDISVVDGAILALANYVAFVAAQRHIAPRAIYVIGDQHPVGEFWELIVRDVPNVRFVYREAPLEISGSRITIKQHHSDIVRLQTIYMNGGIYLDTDMVVLRSLDDLLDNDLTMGMIDLETGFGNAFILAKRHNPFIKEWYEKYGNYNQKHWGYNSMQVPRDMYLTDPSRVVNVREQVYQPNWNQINLLVNASHVYDWSHNYAIHLWKYSGQIPLRTDAILVNNSTVGQIFRYILYGDPKVRKKPDV
ncbi:uncharacterized protein LOC131939989 [Physella acuta]|uniref:uncharacterized protein LOC131939989 n=1 Tax=Physella acuta TaxID=109671 RepID=UPI0027DCC2DA|nr:uncharacterized protein LOC131939989 [Physella acuta]